MGRRKLCQPLLYRRLGPTPGETQHQQVSRLGSCPACPTDFGINPRTSKVAVQYCLGGRMDTLWFRSSTLYRRCAMGTGKNQGRQPTDTCRIVSMTSEHRNCRSCGALITLDTTHCDQCGSDRPQPLWLHTAWALSDWLPWIAMAAVIWLQVLRL